jgi:hypothetical protein
MTSRVPALIRPGDIRGDERAPLARPERGFLSTKSTVVPLHEATFEQDRIVVPFTNDQIRNAPDVAPDAISQHLEQRPSHGP